MPVSRALRFAFLGSGSRGNAALVESGGTCVMVDCGFSAGETERRLARLGREPTDVGALLITHEHADHVGGAYSFAARHDIEVWMTPGTHAAVGEDERVRVRRFSCHGDFAVGDLAVEPLPVPHDAREPCQFVFSDGRHRLAVLTDTGHVTRHILRVLGRCDALALECNHDTAMLRRGPYPPMLKRRVGGDFGHLSNDQAASLLDAIDVQRLQHLVAVHVSEKNNTAALALGALAGVLGCGAGEIGRVDQDEGLDWRTLTAC